MQEWEREHDLMKQTQVDYFEVKFLSVRETGLSDQLQTEGHMLWIIHDEELWWY